MKSQLSATKAALSSLQRAHKVTNKLKGELDAISNGEPAADVMPRIRTLLAELNQRIHEFNAYNNVVETE